MKGFMKACVITSLICICLGTVITVGAVASGGWHEIVRLARNGELGIIAYNDGWYDESRFWQKMNRNLELGSIADINSEMQDMQAELNDIGQDLGDIWNDTWSDAWDVWDDTWEEAQEEIQNAQEEMQSAMDDAAADIGQSFSGDMEAALGQLAAGIEEYNRNGGDAAAEAITEGNGINRMDIDIGGGAVYLLPSGDDKIHILGRGGTAKYSCYRDGDTFVFRDVRENRLKDYNNRKIYISIPQDITWEEAQIDLGGGLIAADTLRVRNLLVNTGAGMAVIDHLYAQKAEVETGAGELIVNSGIVQEMDMEVGAGYVYYGGGIKAGLDISCGMGMIEMLLEGSSSEHNYQMATSAGSISINGGGDGFCSGLGAVLERDNGAESNYNLSCGIGNIAIYFTDNTWIMPEY